MQVAGDQCWVYPIDLFFSVSSSMWTAVMALHLVLIHIGMFLTVSSISPGSRLVKSTKTRVGLSRLRFSCITFCGYSCTAYKRGIYSHSRISRVLPEFVRSSNYARMCQASVKQTVDVFAIAVLVEVILTLFVCVVAFIILLLPNHRGARELTNFSQDAKEEQDRKAEIGSNAR